MRDEGGLDLGVEGPKGRRWGPWVVWATEPPFQAGALAEVEGGEAAPRCASEQRRQS